MMAKLKSSVLALVGALLFSNAAIVEAQPIISEGSAFDTWREHYYQRPQVRSVPMMLVFYTESPFYSHIPSRARVGRFFAELFREDPLLMRETLRFVDDQGSENSKLFFLNALWLADTEDSTLTLIRASSRWNSAGVRLLMQELSLRPPKDIMVLELDHPSQVNELWEMFFATGKKAPLLRIIEQLAAVRGKDELAGQIGAAALLSLKYYVRTHPQVFEVCVQAMVGADSVTLGLLEEVLASAYAPGDT